MQAESLVGLRSRSAGRRRERQRGDEHAVPCRGHRAGARALAGARLRAQALNDKVRWPIPPGYPELLSQGNATELVRFVRELADGVGLSSAESASVSCSGSARGLTSRWLRSRSASIRRITIFFDRGAWLWNKTGTLLSVRSDVGMYMSPERRIAYAVTAQWNRGADPRDEVLAAMADIGTLIKQSL